MILYWFKVQSAKAANKELVKNYERKVIQEILLGYWQKYLQL